MSPGTIGGILLIVGAYFTMRGDIFKSVLIYFLADISWVCLALLSGDILGATLTGIGMTLGLIAFLKMHFGKMRKTLQN